MTNEVTEASKPTSQPIAVTAPVAQPTVAAEQPTPQLDMQAVATALLADIPEHLRGLIPKIDPASQIQWYADAKTTGVFSDGKPVVPETDSGRPTVTPTEPNLNDLPVMARMSRGYSQ